MICVGFSYIYAVKAILFLLSDRNLIKSFVRTESNQSNFANFILHHLFQMISALVILINFQVHISRCTISFSLISIVYLIEARSQTQSNSEHGKFSIFEFYPGEPARCFEARFASEIECLKFEFLCGLIADVMGRPRAPRKGKGKGAWHRKQTS